MAAKEFAVPLRLVSPHMRGPKVKDAQYLLAGHNRFANLATYKDGALDGDYGPLTAQATKRAKYWLGYPTGSCDTNFGQTIYEYLRINNWRPLPAAYRDRRDARVRAAAATPGKRALDYGIQFVGVIESPRGSNCQEFGAWYHMNCCAWCAIFASYCFGHTASPGFRYSYVPAIYEDARANRNGLYIVRTPRVGDLALYNWSGEIDAHVGFVRTIPEGGEFTDLSGNTGSASFNNGGEVLISNRELGLVHVFVRYG